MRDDSNNFDLDVGKLDEIDHQLRLVRIFCNHAKHGKKKNEIPPIDFDKLIKEDLLIKKGRSFYVP